MKKKCYPIVLFSSSILALTSHLHAGDYLVRRGDYFTRIVEAYAIEEPRLSYSQALYLFIRLNGKRRLADFNHIQIGEFIRRPTANEIQGYLKQYRKRYPPYWNPSLWKNKAKRKYVVKPGDTLGKIAKRLFPGLEVLGENGSIQLLQRKNPSIVNIDKIYGNVPSIN